MIFITSMARSMQKSLASNASWILAPEVTLNNGWQSMINFHTSLSVSRWHKDKVANRDLYRHGYKDVTKQSGALPRISEDSPRIHQIKVFRPSNPFAPKEALFGQNDYIDILGK